MNGLQDKLESSIKHTEKMELAVEQLSDTVRKQRSKLAESKKERDNKRRSINASDDEVHTHEGTSDNRNRDIRLGTCISVLLRCRGQQYLMLLRSLMIS